MRADRLLSILLLLQAHGRLSARHLAERLEVSERTISRDMEALSIAGVPVYAERGRRGGWELTEDYRTDLTGLTESELRSLVVTAAPGVLAGLGLGDAADRALVKLLATLPESRRREAETARRYLHVDPGGWRRTEEAAPLLPLLDEALRRGRRIRMEYERWADRSIVERLADPLGLVAKGSVWYLVAAVDDQVRTYRASRLRGVSVLDDPVRRPDGFDLAAFWGRSRDEYETRLPSFEARIRVRPAALDRLRAGWWRFVQGVEAGDPDGHGWTPVVLRTDTIEVAHGVVLGLGGEAVVLGPRELRDRVLAAAVAITASAMATGSDDVVFPASDA